MANPRNLLIGVSVATAIAGLFYFHKSRSKKENNETKALPESPQQSNASNKPLDEQWIVYTSPEVYLSQGGFGEKTSPSPR